MKVPHSISAAKEAIESGHTHLDVEFLHREKIIVSAKVTVSEREGELTSCPADLTSPANGQARVFATVYFDAFSRAP
jgi:hypothetical protein